MEKLPGGRAPSPNAFGRKWMSRSRVLARWSAVGTRSMHFVLLLLTVFAVASCEQDSVLPTAPEARADLEAASTAGSSGAAELVTGMPSERCLDVPNVSREPGTRLIIWECNGGENQQWSLQSNGEIRVYGDRCLDAANGRGGDGDSVIIWNCNGGENQQWSVTDEGEIRGINGKCLDVADEKDADGAELILWRCHGGDNQQWIRRGVNSNAAPPPAPSPPPPPSPSPPSPGSGVAELPRVYLNTRYVAPTGRTINVRAGGDFQDALDAAEPGDEIVLQAGAVFNGHFRLPRKSGSGWVTIRSSGALPPEGTRVGPSNRGQMARLETPNYEPVLHTEAGAHQFRVVGVELTFASSATWAYSLVSLGNGNAGQNTLDVVPRDLILDRVYMHGRPGLSFRRCVSLNSASTAIIDSYVAECHGKGMDTQAIAGWNGPGPYKIVNNYLEGAGENVIFGGSDAQIPELAPADIEFRRNWVRKDPAWFRSGEWTVKNLFEVKSATRLLVEGNVFENVWADAQTGFALLLKGDAGKNAQTRDLTIRNNIIRNALSGVTLHPNPDSRIAVGGPAFMRRVYIANNRFERIGKRSDYGATNGSRMWQLLGPLTDVTVEHNTAADMWSQNEILIDGREFRNLSFTDNLVGPGAYGLSPRYDRDRGDYTVTGNWVNGSENPEGLPQGNCITSAGASRPDACAKAGVNEAELEAATAGVAR